MKHKSVLVWLGLVGLVALVFVPSSAAARVTRVEFTGIELFSELLDPGEWIPLPSGNVHVRGMTTVYEEVATDPRVSGLLTSVLNANWGPDYAGPMWGTAENQIPDGPDCPGGGVWQSSWTGTAYPDGSYSYGAVMRGVSGCVAGLHASLAAVNPGFGDTTYSGEILCPHGE